MKLLISANGIQHDYMKEIVKEAEGLFDEVYLNPWGRRATYDELRAVIKGYDAIVCGAEPMDKAMIEYACPELKVISRFGVGYDSVDLETAAKHGIPVCNTPGANTLSVADLAMFHILNLARKGDQHISHAKKGEWKRFQQRELDGMTLGIVGFGSIGKQVARRAYGFGMKIIAYDMYFDQATADKYEVKQVTLDELYKESDIITLHAPSTPETENMINKDSISKMKDGVFIVNTARGGLINEEDLCEAVKSGKVGGAGIDVYKKEPLKSGPLTEIDDIATTPHSAATTIEAYQKMARMSIKNAYDVLAGNECRSIVNKEALKKNGF